MHRSEYRISLDTHPSVATFIKYVCKSHLLLPRLSLGIVLINTTTAINEEWLTVIESLPTYKIYYQYVYEILTGEYNMCVHLRKTQAESDTYISLGDMCYYLIKPNNEIVKLDPIKELKETLLHTFSEFRPKNVKSIEVVAFSSGTTINDELIDKLDFVNTETFNREYKNIKSVHSSEFEGYLPFGVIAPEGNLCFFMEKYSWFDHKRYLKRLFSFLEESIDENLAKVKDLLITNNMKLEENNERQAQTCSAYDSANKILFVNDVTIMCLANFAGCNCQLGSYHRFDISAIDVKAFSKAISKTIKQIHSAVN